MILTFFLTSKTLLVIEALHCLKPGRRGPGDGLGLGSWRGVEFPTRPAAGGLLSWGVSPHHYPLRTGQRLDAIWIKKEFINLTLILNFNAFQSINPSNSYTSFFTFSKSSSVLLLASCNVDVTELCHL